MTEAEYLEVRKAMKDRRLREDTRRSTRRDYIGTAILALCRSAAADTSGTRTEGGVPTNVAGSQAGEGLHQPGRFAEG